MPYEEFPQREKFVTWDELQRNISADAGLDNVPGFTGVQKQAGIPELNQEGVDSLFANTSLLNEKVELQKHIKRLLDEKHPYLVLERMLRNLGYPAVNIRKVFEEETGINPVDAFLDFESYPKPPCVVPTYNYGWGKAKGDKKAYLFILPWTSKYAIYRQEGLDRTIDSEHMLLSEAREELKKKVDALRDVSPDGVDILTDLLHKVAAVSRLSVAGADFYKQAESLIATDPDHVAKAALQALESGKITDMDFQVIAERLIQAADPAPMSAPQRVDERSFADFRDQQEGRGFKEMKMNTLMPGQEFTSNWQDRHKVDFWGLLAESRSMFQQLISMIDGFRIEPSWGTFKIMPQPNLSLDNDNHILDGSVAVGATVEKLGTNEQSEIAIMFFIHGGKLKYTGKFRGINERDYAFSSLGLSDYFDDLSGESALDERLERGSGGMGLQGIPPSPTVPGAQ